mmetsp:Transcript_1886/g.2835  ORF Transcript_1886/g.2835 Transcript_1886/m.2835 type:complete len:261 (+) Transcript_1886:411-1193(+)
MARPSKLARCALLLSRFDQIHDFIKLELINLWSLCGPLYKWIPNLDRFCHFVHLFNKLVVDGVLHKKTGTCTAALALVQKETYMSCSYSLVQICIFANNQRTLASKFKGDILEVALACVLLDQLANSSATGKANLINFRVKCKRLSSRWTESTEYLNNSRGEPSLLHQARNGQSSQWCFLRGLDNQDISCCQSWSKFPCKHKKRKIPWDDSTTYTHRFVKRHGKKIPVNWDSFPFDLVCPTSIVPDAFCYKCKINIRPIR